MAVRAPPSEAAVPSAEDPTLTVTQVLERPTQLSAQSNAEAPDTVPHVGLSQKAQLTQQQPEATAVTGHTEAWAIGGADSAAADNGKKRKAEVEALQLAQAATAVVINAGKRRLSPEAEVKFVRQVV